MLRDLAGGGAHGGPPGAGLRDPYGHADIIGRMDDALARLDASRNRPTAPDAGSCIASRRTRSLTAAIRPMEGVSGPTSMPRERRSARKFSPLAAHVTRVNSQKL